MLQADAVRVRSGRGGSARAIVIAAALLAHGLGHAASAGPASFSVSATIVDFCTISATNVAFGSINAGAGATNAAGRVNLTCNKGASVPTVALNNGANALGTQKRMRRGAERLSYHIDVPTGPTFNTCPASGAGPEWNAANTISATPLFAASGGTRQITLCASIPAGQYPLAGNYTDTVRVTATYN